MGVGRGSMSSVSWQIGEEEREAMLDNGDGDNAYHVTAYSSETWCSMIGSLWQFASGYSLAIELYRSG